MKNHMRSVLLSTAIFFTFIFVTSAFDGEKLCEKHGQFYLSNNVCAKNRTSFVRCIWNDDAFGHDAGEMYHCPIGERCHCFKGEECEKIEDMCIKDVKQLPLIDHGVLTWKFERFYDCSHCDEANTDTTSVFSYKLQNGKYYREELKDGQYSSYFDRILYEPNEQGGFTKFYRRDQQNCATEENISKDDVEKLVKQHIKPDAILEETESRTQHWKWRYQYAGTEKTWHYYLKPYKGELVPILLKDEELQDGMGDGSTLRDTFKYTYYPRLKESNLAEVFDRERTLIEECTIKKM